MIIEFKIQRPVFILLAFFCSILTYAGSDDLLKEAQKALRKKDLKAANAYLLSAEKEEQYTNNAAFWYTKGVLALEVAQSTVYAYEQLYEEPLMVAYQSFKKGLGLTDAESGLLEDYKPQVELLQKLLFNEAGKYYNSQVFSKAIYYFTPLIDLKPQSDYYMNRGLCYLRTDQFVQAQSDFKKAAELGEETKIVDQYYIEALVRDTTSSFSQLDSVLNTILVKYPDEIAFKKKKILFYEQNDSLLTSQQQVELNKLYSEVLKEEPSNTNFAYNYSVGLFNKAVKLNKEGEKSESKLLAEQSIKVIDDYLNHSQSNKDIFESVRRKAKVLLLN